mgnify:FL=1
MAWIESHQSLGGNKKTHKLAETLVISRPTAVGHLQFLWWWALDNTPDGNLAEISDATIAEQCLWTGEAKTFVDALITSRFVTPERIIHNWMRYAGKLLRRREADRKRKQDNESPPVELQRKSAGVPPEPVRKSRCNRNRTVTVNPTVPIKNIYGEFKNVELTDAELEKLTTRFGKDKTFALIEMLSGGIESKGYKYRSCYAAILTWERNDKKREANSPSAKAPIQPLARKEEG